MKYLSIFLITILFLISVGFVWKISQDEPSVIYDQDIQYKNVVPMITSSYDCDLHKVTWYIRNSYDMQFKIQWIGRDNQTLSKPMVSISPNGTYEFDEIVNLGLENVSLEVSGEYKFIAEPHYYYDIDVKVIGNADLTECRQGVSK